MARLASLPPSRSIRASSRSASSNARSVRRRDSTCAMPTCLAISAGHHEEQRLAAPGQLPELAIERGIGPDFRRLLFAVRLLQRLGDHGAACRRSRRAAAARSVRRDRATCATARSPKPPRPNAVCHQPVPASAWRSRSSMRNGSDRVDLHCPRVAESQSCSRFGVDRGIVDHDQGRPAPAPIGQVLLIVESSQLAALDEACSPCLGRRARRTARGRGASCRRPPGRSAPGPRSACPLASQARSSSRSSRRPTSGIDGCKGSAGRFRRRPRGFSGCCVSFR